MEFAKAGIRMQTLPGAIPVRAGTAGAAQLVSACTAVREGGGALVALWACDERDRAGGFALHVALQDEEGLAVLTLPLDAGAPEYPDLSAIFPCASRMQRAARDLMGVRAKDADARPWLRHAAWPPDAFPLRRDFDPATAARSAQERYPFVRVQGDGVHEIAVGPVHAGTIEPGHFRFSVVGEKVLRLEERLGYVHKGIEKRFESLRQREGQRLAAHISGDSAVAFSWAYCMALESACGVTPPSRALWLRALCLERERIANHLGDLGAIGNDAGFGFGLAQFMRLKEDVLRANAAAFGARYLMDAIVPGGVARDLAADAARSLSAQALAVEKQVEELREIYDNHAGMQDRFQTCGVVSARLADQLGLTGLAGRASSVARDLRCDHPCAPYDVLGARMMIDDRGDVAARVTVRFEETLESLRLCRLLLDRLPAGRISAALGDAPDGARGFGWIEGWRGPVLVALETGAGATIRRCHPHDPSWQNWPLLEHAVIGNIVPDFPLINKSFNLSYSGHDL